MRAAHPRPRWLCALLAGLWVLAPPIFAADTPSRRIDAWRLLTQATFGPTETDMARVLNLGLEGWIDEQIALPFQPRHLDRFDKRLAERGQGLGFQQSFWKDVLSGDDQLRQRMAFALSEIFVVSAVDACGGNAPRAIPSYHDMLLERAFGRYRDLLEAVAKHPLMGCYLSHLRNRRADWRTGRVPDENFARELMQLFTIGLVTLNADGVVRKDIHGSPIESFNEADVKAMARVFTGWSWSCPAYPSDDCFEHWGAVQRPAREDPWTAPMQGYLKYHDNDEKRFLGLVLPARNTPDPEQDLDDTLDHLVRHPNTAPFIAAQLIKRFVCSNPSPAYVSRVAQVFLRSDGLLGATLRAILLDPEARRPQPGSPAAQGKVREPMLRMSAMLRAFDVRSRSGLYKVGSTQRDDTELGQNIYHAPSVFSFFRPTFTPVTGPARMAGLVAPELQITHETSVAGYANFMNAAIWAGLHERDLIAPYQQGEPLHSLADHPEAVLAIVDARLLGQQMSPALRQDILGAMDSIQLVPHGHHEPALQDRTRSNRWWTAIFLTILSPEFIVQR
jgi:uncharacterized protein (DUF1800 family)